LVSWLEQAVFANQIFRFLVIDQQAVGELNEFRVGLRSLGAFYYGHGYSLRLAVSCQMTVYTKLKTPSSGWPEEVLSREKEPSSRAGYSASIPRSWGFSEFP